MDEIKEIIRKHYLTFLDREPDSVGLEHYFDLIRDGKLKIQDLEDIFKNSDEYKRKEKEQEIVDEIDDKTWKIIRNQDFIDKELSEEPNELEPEIVCVSCFNVESGFGGVYQIESEKLIPIYEGRGCFGMSFDNVNKILFVATREEPQLLAFRIIKNKFEQIHVKFTNYLFGLQAHGILCHNQKIHVIATDGLKDDKEAINKDVPWKGIGKIITSKVSITEKHIEISDSEVANPFECEHHHHINDLCLHKDRLYLSSHSYCDREKSYVKKGIITKLDEKLHSLDVIEGFEQPHSPFSYKNRLFICSSAIACVMSIDTEEKSIKLEYKGIDAYTRGIVNTEKFLYIGTSFSVGRTNATFNNPNIGVLKFNKRTGDAKYFKIPEKCTNVYSIVKIT